MTNRCSWCLTGDHDEAHCPRIAGLKVVGEFGVIDPATAEEVNDVLSLRMIAYRTVKNALLGYAKEHGFAYPASILALDPDHIQP